MRITKKLSFLQYSLLALLIAAVAVFFSACGKGEEKTDESTGDTITITVEVKDPDGKSTEHEVSTTATNLADAITGAGIASGDEGEYGLYITTVDGITADYNTDGAYWALYKNGEYLMTGASDTPIADGEHYEIVYTVDKAE